MKVKFNEVGGKVVKDKFPYCNNCIFNNTKFCEMDPINPLFVLCDDIKFLKSNLDIFEL